MRSYEKVQFSMARPTFTSRYSFHNMIDLERNLMGQPLFEMRPKNSESLLDILTLLVLFSATALLLIKIAPVWYKARMFNIFPITVLVPQLLLQSLSFVVGWSYYGNENFKLNHVCTCTNIVVFILTLYAGITLNYMVPQLLFIYVLQPTLINYLFIACLSFFVGYGLSGLFSEKDISINTCSDRFKEMGSLDIPHKPGLNKRSSSAPPSAEALNDSVRRTGLQWGASLKPVYKDSPRS